MLAPLVIVVAVLVASAAAVLFLKPRRALWVGTILGTGACGVGVVCATIALTRLEVDDAAAHLPMPIGALHVGVDSLSAFFLVCIFIVCALGFVYARGYLAHDERPRVAPLTSCFLLLAGAMAGLVLARDALLFLFCWEATTVASVFLVGWHHERDEARRSAMTYLIASQTGAVLVLALFAVLHKETGSFDLVEIARIGVPAAAGTTCFLLALLGFGIKAGFWPLHLWVPDTYPAAPSHVSAVMSGVLAKMGIYGLLRTLVLLGDPRVSWGAVLVAVGAVSGVFGLVNALGQRDLKRMLAYSSIENVGVIATGLGIAMLGQAHGDHTIAFLGYAGALLHVLTHGLMKGLLFQSSGVVHQETGTRDMNALGGLSRAMPVTAALFLVGALAICALPPLAGFASEWLIYRATFAGALTLPTGWQIATVAALGGLALVGGLAAACFVRAYGLVFLGDARTDAVKRAHEPSLAVRLPMIAGAVGILLIGLYPQGGLLLVSGPARRLARVVENPVELPFAPIVTVATVVGGLVVLLAILRRRLLRGRVVQRAPTWGCAYAHPSPRMQYTSEGFTDPLTAPFSALLTKRVTRTGPDGVFPPAASYVEHVGDMAGDRLVVPVAKQLVETLSRVRIIQQGRVNLYLAYIFATLVALLVWKIGGAK